MPTIGQARCEAEVRLGRRMADPAPIGRNVSPGTYRCTTCGYTIDTRSVTLLRACVSCGGPNEWAPIARDSTDDPYPNRRSR